MVYRDGVFLDVQDLNVNLNILVGSLSALIEETILQSQVDIVSDIICEGVRV